MCNINVAIVLLDQNILSKLVATINLSLCCFFFRCIRQPKHNIPVDECIVELKFQHKLLQFGLNLRTRVFHTIDAGSEDAQSVGGASVHGEDSRVGCGEVVMRCVDFGSIPIARAKGPANNFCGGNTSGTRRVAPRVKWFLCLA